jgi:hypothetical protein
LTITATADEQWPLGGTGDRALHVTGVRLVFTQPGGLAVTLHVTGAVADAEVPMAGNLDDDGRISARLVPVPAPGPARTVSLAALADFVSDNTMAGYLPPPIPPFDTVPLSDLAVSIGYGASAVTELTSTSTLDNATWEPVAGLASLTGIGVTLTNEVRPLAGLVTETVGGDIHATVHLGQDFTVRLALRAAGDWAVEILPADGNVLPALADLASLAGDHTLGDKLQSGLQAIGLSALAIDGVRVAFDLPTHEVRQVTVGGHVTLDDIRFDIEAAMPGLTVHGGIAADTPIHLRKLVSAFFPGRRALPRDRHHRTGPRGHTGHRLVHAGGGDRRGLDVRCRPGAGWLPGVHAGDPEGPGWLHRVRGRPVHAIRRRLRGGRRAAGGRRRVAVHRAERARFGADGGGDPRAHRGDVLRRYHPAVGHRGPVPGAAAHLVRHGHWRLQLHLRSPVPGRRPGRRHHGHHPAGQDRRRLPQDVRRPSYRRRPGVRPGV